MGTRNLTRVISNGQLKIEQYCQWDGYPTGRGGVVLAFARDLYKGGSVDELKDYLETTRLVNAKDHGCENSTYTGAPYDNHTGEVFELVDDYARMHSHVSDRENVESMLDKGMITMKDAQRYIVASRDIGNDVLGFILKHKPEGMTFYTDDYLSEMPPQGDWQIEAVHVLDLDNEKVDLWWHGRQKSYSFEQLSELTDEQINNDMRSFESGVNEVQDQGMGGFQ